MKLGSTWCDEEIIKKTRSKKITFLETCLEQVDFRYSLKEIKISVGKTPLLSDPDLVRMFQILHLIYTKNVSDLLISLRENCLKSYQKRENRWFNTHNLIKTFLNAKSPITFIAGIGHMERVLNRFKKAGFTVKLV